MGEGGRLTVTPDQICVSVTYQDYSKITVIIIFSMPLKIPNLHTLLQAFLMPASVLLYQIF